MKTMNAPQHLPEGKDEAGADYDALRCDLVDLLMDRRSQGRFDGASGQPVSFDVLCLARSIADVLIASRPKQDGSVYASVLADAEAIAATVLNPNQGKNHARNPLTHDYF
jgi:hypothetical protein